MYRYIDRGEFGGIVRESRYHYSSEHFHYLVVGEWRLQYVPVWMQQMLLLLIIKTAHRLCSIFDYGSIQLREKERRTRQGRDGMYDENCCGIQLYIKIGNILLWINLLD